MQFLIIARDGKDEHAAARRQAARPAHLAMSEEAHARHEQLFGVALLDDHGQMRGSMMVVEFPSRAELDAWLAQEPYVTGKVWQRVEVVPCQVGPTFAPPKSRKLN